MLTIYNLIGTSLCVVSNWIIRIYIILVWNTISGSSNLDTYFYHCLILILIFLLKVLINFFFFFFFFFFYYFIIVVVVVVVVVVVIVVVVLLLFIIYTINLHVVRPRSCRIIYYFDTLTFGKRHQFFGRVIIFSSKFSQLFLVQYTFLGFLKAKGIWCKCVNSVGKVNRHEEKKDIIK